MEIGYIDNAPNKTLTQEEREEILEAVRATRMGLWSQRRFSYEDRAARFQRLMRLAVRHEVSVAGLYYAAEGRACSGYHAAQVYGLQPLYEKAKRAGAQGGNVAFRKAWAGAALNERLQAATAGAAKPVSSPALSFSPSSSSTSSEPLTIEIKRGNNHARFTITTDNDVTLAAQVMRGWI